MLLNTQVFESFEGKGGELRQFRQGILAIVMHDVQTLGKISLGKFALILALFFDLAVHRSYDLVMVLKNDSIAI